jgi:hypothetical protein
MKHLHHHLMLATALAAGLVVAAPLVISQVSAEESATVPTNPGFNPGTGQINPGFTEQARSQSTRIIEIPTPEEARAAFIMPGWKEPSLGQALTVPSQGAELPQDKNTNQASQNAAGGPPGIGPEANRPGGGPTAPGQPQPNPGGSTGSAASSSSGSTVSPSPQGPIGSTGQTTPTKFSKRNEILDRVPIMAWPMSLTDQERQQIYQAVMADKSQPAANADKLAPASELSTDQALNGMHALPASLGDIAAVTGLKYVKAKDKVLLVQASTRTVVEQITP